MQTGGPGKSGSDGGAGRAGIGGTTGNEGDPVEGRDTLTLASIVGRAGTLGKAGEAGKLGIGGMLGSDGVAKAGSETATSSDGGEGTAGNAGAAGIPGSLGSAGRLGEGTGGKLHRDMTPDLPLLNQSNQRLRDSKTLPYFTLRHGPSEFPNLFYCRLGQLRPPMRFAYPGFIRFPLNPSVLGSWTPFSVMLHILPVTASS